MILTYSAAKLFLLKWRIFRYFL